MLLRGASRRRVPAETEYQLCLAAEILKTMQEQASKIRAVKLKGCYYHL